MPAYGAVAIRLVRFGHARFLAIGAPDRGRTRGSAPHIIQDLSTHAFPAAGLDAKRQFRTT
jgi:hypothetical protein